MNSSSNSIAVRVPASSANIGPGFDVLGMALSLHLEAGFGSSPADSIEATQNHPVLVAFKHCGGQGPLWVRSQMPMGKGLGFSGAARVAGVSLAHAQKNGSDEIVFRNAQTELLAIATELEGHPDNVSASLLGGVVASVAGSTVRIPTQLDPAIIVWVPQEQTSTRESRTKLPTTVSFADAVFNVGRTALLVAALAAGDISALQTATQDRLHQDVRFKKFQRRKPRCLVVLMLVRGVHGCLVLGQLLLRCVTPQMRKILPTSFQIKVRQWSCELPPKAHNFSQSKIF